MDLLIVKKDVHHGIMQSLNIQVSDGYL